MGISTIITAGGCIFHWEWIARNRERCSRRHLERLFNFRRSVACIIIMNGWRRDNVQYEFSGTTTIVKQLDSTRSIYCTTRGPDQFRAAVSRFMRRLQKLPKILNGFFRDPNLAYINI